MRIYLHDKKSDDRILRACQAQKVELLTPEIVAQRDDVVMGHLSFLSQVDALVLEITKPTRDLQFILAQAIIAQKPTLCLYAKNQAPRELLSLIRHRSGRPIKTFSYTDSSVDDAVFRFVRRYDPNSDRVDDIPSIKYTLRMSPRIDRYLSWKAEQEGDPKANLIRQMLQDLAEEDDLFTDESEKK